MESAETGRFTALVLAGRRGSADVFDPSAPSVLKAVWPIDGVPMIERVVRSVASVPAITRIVVCGGGGDVRGAAEAGLSAAGVRTTDISEERVSKTVELQFIDAADSPSASVAAFVEALPPGGGAMVTTADHPLLTREMMEFFLARARASSGAVVAAVVPAASIRARFPDMRRTYLRLRGGDYCGANLFYVRGDQALPVLRFWRRAEMFRKKPLRLASLFGVGTLVLFALRRLTLPDAVARVARVVGVDLAVVELPFAEASVDVDRVADVVIVEKILAERDA